MTTVAPAPTPNVHAGPRAVIYVRQSRAKDDSISLANQEQLGRDYCAQKGYRVVAVKQDVVSGRKWDARPGVLAAMGMLDRHEADVIVIWKWSRLSRSRLHWAVAADRADLAGGRVESVTEPIDTSTASGRFARGVMTEYAAFQSEQIGENWAEVRAHRVRAGLPPTGGNRYGYSRDGDTYTPHPAEAPILADMYRRAVLGDGPSAIARWANISGIMRPSGGYWDVQGLRRVLDSGFAAGRIVELGSRRSPHPRTNAYHPGRHPAIIDDDTWNKYLSLRLARSTEAPARAPHMLSRLVKCTEHGAMSYSTNHEVSVLRCTVPRGTGGHSVRAHLIELYIIEWVSALPDNIGKIHEQVERASKSLANHQKQIRGLRERLERVKKRTTTLTIRHLDDKIPDDVYAATIATLEEERIALESRLTEAPPSVFDVQSVPLLAEGFGDLPPMGQNRVLRKLLWRIDLTPPTAHPRRDWRKRIIPRPKWIDTDAER
ncbi:hypothetical protein GCM10010915_12210 [Microbacterium faecale]|uniref:Recombinase family protein n=1 Tax=Microbacterium faecale TaxID=1804630 RepID=A0A916Y6P3_9MICO|nr:recombinase family protein [Microbacterium faecale]GGD33385.1 hypothetical protein GCM10010915_12210 [Microbacterium faecale]